MQHSAHLFGTPVRSGTPVPSTQAISKISGTMAELRAMNEETSRRRREVRLYLASQARGELFDEGNPTGMTCSKRCFYWFYDVFLQFSEN